MLTFDAIERAAARLEGVVHRTPVVTSRTLDAIVGRHVYLKCENLQRGGAFKFRGAYNTIVQLDAAQRHRGVLAYSSGNHAQGVALAGQLLGIPATIVMPQDAPKVKLEATRGYGAEVIFYDRFTQDRAVLSHAIAEQRGLALIPPYDHFDVMAGQGTAALELLRDCPQIDSVVVPISGGGLLAGCAVAAHGLNPAIAAFGVEPSAADDTRQSLAAGERVTIGPPDTIADGLRSPTPGALTFPILQEHVAAVVMVSEDEILDAVRFALLRLKLVLEPSGAVGLAAAMTGKLPATTQHVGVILTGGNIEPELLAALW